MSGRAAQVVSGQSGGVTRSTDHNNTRPVGGQSVSESR